MRSVDAWKRYQAGELGPRAQIDWMVAPMAVHGGAGVGLVLSF
jgi:hypothetical protein